MRMGMTRWVGVAATLVGVTIVLGLIGPGPVTNPLAERRGDNGGETQAPATTAAPLPPATTEAPRIVPTEEIPAAATELVRRPSADDLLAVVTAMAGSGDHQWVPYLVDLRLLANRESFGEIIGALAELTGEPAPEDLGAAYLQYGRWMYANAIDAGPDYVAWKAELYSLIDTRFGALMRQVTDPVLAAQMQWGGVAVAGIPELNDQPTITVAEADYMLDDELTFGAEINGEARAYPHRILDHHELANDTLGGEPVALVNCTLCRTGVLYSRRLGDRVLNFQTSGLLWNSNKVMLDVETNSLWQQLTGVAIAGELTGAELERFTVTVTFFGDWVAEHPDTDVVSIPTGGGYSYQPGDAYAEYFGSADLWFPTFEVPAAFDPKDQVATLDVEGAQLAVGVDALIEAGPQLLGLGELEVIAVPTTAGARFYQAPDAPLTADLEAFLAAATVTEDAIDTGGVSYARIQSGQSYWFAWYANFPETRWWPEA